MGGIYLNSLDRAAMMRAIDLILHSFADFPIGLLIGLEGHSATAQET
jgi:porphobilinogen deaminase